MLWDQSILFFFFQKKTYDGEIISEVIFKQYGDIILFFFFFVQEKKKLKYLLCFFSTRQFCCFVQNSSQHTTHILPPHQSWPVSIICCTCLHKPTLTLLFLNYHIQVKFFNFWNDCMFNLCGPDSNTHKNHNIFCGTFNVLLSNNYLHWSHVNPPHP